MKKRRTFLSLFMLSSLAFVGVGYAALTRTLDATATLKAETNVHNFNVKFDPTMMGYEIVQGDSAKISVAVSPDTTNEQKANITLSGISGYHDTVVVYLLVVNNSEPANNLAAVLSDPVVKVTYGSENKVAEDLSEYDNDYHFLGDHFDVVAEYVTENPTVTNGTDPIKNSSAAALTHANLGRIESIVEGESSVQRMYLGPKADLNAVKGDGVWLKVTYKMVDVATSELDIHKVSVTFNASSVEKINQQVEQE